MRKLLVLILLCFSFTGFAQEIIDSSIVKEYPVRYGIVYKYYVEEVFCRTEYPGVVIVTPQDSVFHFSDGKVIDIFSLEEYYCAVIRNCDNMIIAYSGLKLPFVKKGESLKRGSFIGLINEKSLYHDGMNEMDVLILKGTNSLSQKECLNYTLAMRELSQPLSAYTW